MADKYKTIRRKLHKEAARQKMCLDKVKFESEEEAHQKGQRSYKCPHCGKWHRSGSMSKFLSRYK